MGQGWPKQNTEDFLAMKLPTPSGIDAMYETTEYQLAMAVVQSHAAASTRELAFDLLANLRDKYTRQPAPPKDAEPVARRSVWIVAMDLAPNVAPDHRVAAFTNNPSSWTARPMSDWVEFIPAPSADQRDAHLLSLLADARECVDASLMNATLQGQYVRIEQLLKLIGNMDAELAIARDAQNARKGEEG